MAPPTKRRRMVEDPSLDAGPIPPPTRENTPPTVNPLYTKVTSSPLTELSSPSSTTAHPTQNQFCLVPQPQPDGATSDPPYPFLARPPHVRRVHPPMPALPDLKHVKIFHPVRNILFLWLPAYDHLNASAPRQPEFGCHHETALTACTIVAFNRPGFLSTSRDRADSRARAPPGREVLRPGEYYYHLRGHRAENYPLCVDFRKWRFPHRTLPPAWVTAPAVAAGPVQRYTESEADYHVTERDKVCLVSGSEEHLATAHVVPGEEEAWFDRNGMERYIGEADQPFHRSVHNMFVLQTGLCVGGFDEYQFVVVPKSGKLVVHFLRGSPEAAGLYHNTVFEHGNSIPRELLYARFAWALFRKMRAAEIHLLDLNGISKP